MRRGLDTGDLVGRFRAERQILSALQADQADSSPLPAPSSILKGKAGYDVVRGDLDATGQKAMHVDPTQRYSPAKEMDADLQRFLNGRPVLAQPDTVRVRLGKLHKCRPWHIPSALAVMIVIVGFVFALLTYNNELCVEQERVLHTQNFLKRMVAKGGI